LPGVFVGDGLEIKVVKHGYASLADFTRFEDGGVLPQFFEKIQNKASLTGHVISLSIHPHTHPRQQPI
jgi:hypothetical protein